jgi:hypothetical protein
VNARHTDEELDRTAETLAHVAARHGFLGPGVPAAALEGAPGGPS